MAEVVQVSTARSGTSAAAAVTTGSWLSVRRSDFIPRQPRWLGRSR
jgi:hypothetical protein